ncbi:single-stranded-DNA-specific exonuclease RecJ, partial [Rhodanobacter sp. FW510-R12]
MARGRALSVLQLRRRESKGAPRGWPDSVHPVLQRIYAARGVLEPGQAEHRLARMLSPQLLGGMAQAVELLVEAIRDDWAILIAGDYDCDGATGTAVAVRGLRLLGARRVDYAIPNRFAHGYGLSPAFVASLQPTPQLIVTVDNGVASVAGVAAAQARGIKVIVTDHHLPGEQLPACDALVNPNVGPEKCGQGSPLFDSRVQDARMKNLAGVGVMFYLLLALRAKLHGQGAFGAAKPDLSPLLDLVALGTVADLVPLDFNNRVLVEAGLQRMRSGRACAGIAALVEVGKRSLATLCSTDLAFTVGPRLNAAGRLEDMRLGVACLLTDDAAQARRHAEQLDAINRERRDLQASMVAEAELMAASLGHTDAVGVALFEPSWHAGVVGLVASKLKERLHRPVIAFAPAGIEECGEGSPPFDSGAQEVRTGNTQLRGSARSIPGFHIRDALAAIDARQPGLIERFGGHAMAAGLSLKADDYPRFAAAFDAIARELIEPERLQAVLYT